MAPELSSRATLRFGRDSSVVAINHAVATQMPKMDSLGASRCSSAAIASQAMYAASRRKLAPTSLSAVRSRRSPASPSRRRHNSVAPEAHSITESNPKPTSAMLPASRPAPIAAAASSEFQARVKYSRRRPRASDCGIALLLIAPHQQVPVDERSEVAVNHAVHVADFDLGPVVLHH